ATAELAERRERDRARRRELAGLLHSARAEHEGQLGKVHEREMSVRDLEKSRDVLADRLREDYQVELAELYAESQRNAVGPLPEGETPAGDTGPSSPEAGESGPAPAAALSADEAHREIDELRRKLSRLGSVNL